MSKSPPDGGPAFPNYGHHHQGGEIVRFVQNGMSVRTWLAGQALGGILANERFLFGSLSGPGLVSGGELAKQAVVMADDTMKALGLTEDES